MHVCMEKCKRTDEEVVRGTVLKNFWHSICRKMRSIKLYFTSSVVNASLLLRCGDVEMNPGPLGEIVHPIDTYTCTMHGYRNHT